jgi:hypothetical protein
VAAWRKEKIGPRLVAEQQLLERRPSRYLQPTPLIYGDENRSLGASLGDHLRSLRQASFKELAESRLGILNRPCLHGAPRND